MSNTQNKIISNLLADSDIRWLDRRTIEGMVEPFLNQIRIQALSEKIHRNTAPDVPDDVTGAKKYPDSATLKPTPLEVPDPAEIEGTTQELKTSLPDYGEPQTFLQKIGRAVRSSEKLWQAAQDNDIGAKASARADVYSFMDEARESVDRF